MKSNRMTHDFYKYKKKFNSDGFIVIKNILTKNQVMNAKKDLEFFLKKNSKEFNSRDINFASNNVINSIHNMNEWSWTKKIQKNKNIRSIAKVLIGEEIEDFGAELFSKPAKIGLPAPIHQDNYYWCINNSNALTVWIALEDADSKNGGVYYIKKSHKLGVLEHKPSFAKGSSQTLKYPESMKILGRKKVPTLKAGDCIFHHCLVVHGSNPNKSNRARTGWTVRYKAKSGLIDEFLKSRYERELKIQITQRTK